jgi:hypothetical protein
VTRNAPAPPDPRKRRRNIVLAVVGIAVFLFFFIDDWGRDFITNEAFISADNPDPTLRPLLSARSSTQMAEAVKMAARRIRNWSYVGESRHGTTTSILFVRRNRVLRFADDVTIHVQDRGSQRVVVGESRSRIGFGDLGRNPRNLRRLLDELRTVLDGASGAPLLNAGTPRTTEEP